MPLTSSVQQNVKQLEQDNKIKPPQDKRPQRQIIAIAENVAQKKTGVGSAAHPGFAKAQSAIAAKEGVSADRAGAILAAGARNASKSAVKANPRLKKVGGVGKGR